MLKTEERMQKILAANQRTLARIDQVLTGEDTTSGKSETDVSTCTFTEAARRLRLSRPTVHRLADSGRLQFVRLNGTKGRRILLSSIFDFASGKEG